MYFPFTLVNTPSNLATILITSFFFLFLLELGAVAEDQYKTTSIGIIIDVNTRRGKEVKVAVKIAAQNFNNSSTYHKVALHFHDHSQNPLKAANAAEQLIKEKDVQAIIGMETWEETALVAHIGNRAQVPIISFASTAITQPLVPLQWPFLVQMASSVTEQIQCIASIVRSSGWRKVIPIYELDTYGGDSGTFATITEALKDVGVEIEYNLALPPFSSLSNPKGFVRGEVAKLLSKQSRVFIIIQSSLSLATHLFTEAKEMGLTGKDSAWIMAESITSLLDSINTSVISSMEGALGISTYFSEDTSSFREFKVKFRKKFRSKYPEEENSEMGIYALRAHDSIFALVKAIMKLNGTNSTSTMLLKTILRSSFSGLSGEIQFYGGELSRFTLFRIVNVVGKKYKEIGFWSSKFGFSQSLVSEESGETERGTDSIEELIGSVTWPGDLKRLPKGWSMPSDTKPMKIGVLSGISFYEKLFVKVESKMGSNERIYSGFCIKVFYDVLQILEQNYPLPYEFIPYNGTYDDLVDQVINKTFDAIIGDVTILANRSKYVEFTQPFAESGLTMIVRVKPQAENPWIFLKPFNRGMWAMTAAIMIYTVLIVWLLEWQSNPEFQGSWQKQLSTAFWFTSSSLFFSHREQIHSPYARVVVSVWLFVVLALSSSYTASLSSMLTAPRVGPNVTDIGWLKKNNATIGYDGYSFVRKYLENVLGFEPVNIKNINGEYDYAGEFESGNITAAFIEVPYEKAFFNLHCNKGYTVAGTGGDRFGGLGFVFQKGSPIATDATQAILTLLENGRIKQLENEWFAPSSNCLTSKIPDKADSLSWTSFWGLYLFSGATSTLCYLVFATHQLYQHCCVVYCNMKNKLVMLSSYFHNRPLLWKLHTDMPTHISKKSGRVNDTLNVAGSEEC